MYKTSLSATVILFLNHFSHPKVLHYLLYNTFMYNHHSFIDFLEFILDFKKGQSAGMKEKGHF